MLLLAFVSLQVLDILTTLLFLHNGVSEANPLIRAAFAFTAQPEMALILAKSFAIGLGMMAWHSGRKGLLGKMNVLFALFVAWNLMAAFVGR